MAYDPTLFHSLSLKIFAQIARELGHRAEEKSAKPLQTYQADIAPSASNVVSFFQNSEHKAGKTTLSPPVLPDQNDLPRKP